MSCLFFTVPSTAPTLVSVQTLNSTSIQVKWLAVPEESTHGIPTRYTIYYAYSDGKVYTKVVTPVNVQNTYQEVVSGLSTDQDGKYCSWTTSPVHTRNSNQIHHLLRILRWEGGY